MRWIATLGLVALALSSFPEAAADGSGEECGRAVAWGERTGGNARRERLLELARERAVEDLAARAWSRSLVVERDSSVRSVQGRDGKYERGAFSEMNMILRSVLERYAVHEKLRGGEYTYLGDKRYKEVLYCVPTARFLEARRALRAEHEESIAELGDRMARIEQLLIERQTATAADLLPGLKNDVYQQIAGELEFHSPVSERTQSFNAWLREAERRIDTGAGVAYDLTLRAREMIREGHLTAADGFLDRALAADSQARRALQLRNTVAMLRRERADHLRRAERLAEVGRFAAAERHLGTAAAIDSDDGRSLHDTAAALENLRERYLFLNPRWSLDFQIAMGSLGVDGDRISRNMSAALETPVNAQPPLSIGLGTRVRLGRRFQFLTSAGLGFASLDDSQANELGEERLFDFLQFTAGLGYRTVRKSGRAPSLELSVGAAGEAVRLKVTTPEIADEWTHNQGGYARVALAWRGFALFARYGFGFEQDDPREPSPVGWTSRVQIGLDIPFRRKS